MMNFAVLAVVLAAASAFSAFTPHSHRRTTTSTSRTTALSMVLEKPLSKKIAKIEQLKVESDYLIHPLKEVRRGESSVS